MLKKLEFTDIKEKNPEIGKNKYRPGEKIDDKWSGTFDFLELIHSWKEIVGDHLSELTHPLKIKQNTLFILVKHPAYAQELSFVSPYLIKKIIKKFSRLNNIITKLSFETNTEQWGIKEEAYKQNFVPQKLHPHSPLFKKLKHEAENIFSNIEDESIKEKMISIYIQSQSDQNY